MGTRDQHGGRRRRRRRIASGCNRGVGRSASMDKALSSLTLGQVTRVRPPRLEGRIPLHEDVSPASLSKFLSETTACHPQGCGGCRGREAAAVDARRAAVAHDAARQ